MFINLLVYNNSSSQNLILNGNFEQYNALYCSGAGFDLPYWSYISTPDYFSNLCGSVNGGGAPKNDFGYSFPKNGNAYAGIATKKSPTYEPKECVYQHLINPLIAGKTYYTSFFLSKSDRTRLATEKIGAYFSVNQPAVASGTAAWQSC